MKVNFKEAYKAPANGYSIFCVKAHGVNKIIIVTHI